MVDRHVGEQRVGDAVVAVALRRRVAAEVDRRRERPAQASARDEVGGGDRRGVEAVVLAHHQHEPAFFREPDEPRRLCDGRRERFLDDHMLARQERRPGHLGVECGWQAGQHGVARHARQRLVEVREAPLRRDADARQESLPRGRNRVDVRDRLHFPRAPQHLLGPIQAPKTKSDLDQPELVHMRSVVRPRHIDGPLGIQTSLHRNAQRRGRLHALDRRHR